MEGREEKQPHETWDIPLPFGYVHRIKAEPSRPVPSKGHGAADLDCSADAAKVQGQTGAAGIYSIPLAPTQRMGTKMNLRVFVDAQRLSPRKSSPARPASARRPISPRPIMRAAAGS